MIPAREPRPGTAPAHTHALPDQPSSPQGVELRVSLHEGAAPPPGFIPEPLVWDDVLRKACPSSLYHGDYRFAVHAPDLTDPRARVEHVVLVGVREQPDGTDVVEVEDRLSVSERVLSGAIEAERAAVGGFVRRARRKGDRLFRHHERQARHLHRQGGAVGVAGKGLRTLVALEKRAWHGTLSGIRKVTSGVTSTPDAFRARWGATGRILSHPQGRARLKEGFRHPEILTAKEKAAVLFIGSLAIVGTLILLHLAVTLAVPSFADEWRTLFGLFLYAYFQSLGLPGPIEPLLIPAGAAVGVVATVTITVLAKMLAGYMAFFLGDEVHDKVHARAATRPKFAKFLAWSERFAQKYGTFAMATFIAIPGFPDAIAIYTFGSLGMPLRKYLLGIAIGGTILYTSVLLGALHLLGLG